MLALALTLALLFQEACPDCGKPLKEGAKFCAECGAKMQPKKCPGCGAKVEPKERFCSECGKPLAQEDPLKAGEKALNEAAMLLYVPNSPGFAEKLKKAESLLKEAVEKSPGNAIGHYLLGRVWELEGELQKAETCWRKAVELDRNLGSAQCMLGRLLLIRWTQDVFREEDRKGAIELFRGARRNLDDELAGVLCDAMLALVESRLEEARRLAEEGIHRFGSVPGVEDFHCVLGHAAEGSEARVEAFSQAIRIRPNFPMAHCWRGTAYLHGGKPSEAIADFTTAIEGRHWNGFLHRAEGRFLLGDLQGALADYDEFLRIEPRSAPALVGRARIRMNLGDSRGALEDCDSALARRPDYTPALIARGHCRMMTGEAKEAIADFARAIELDPKSVEAWEHRGSAYLQLREIDRAIQDFTEAIRIDPTRHRAYLMRASAHAGKGDSREAIADYDHAIMLDPRDADAYMGRGVVRAEMGDRDGAIADLERALELVPKEWKHRAAVEKKLAELRK